MEKLIQEAKRHYDELIKGETEYKKKLDEIKKQAGPLKRFLTDAGVIPRQTRERPPKPQR